MPLVCLQLRDCSCLWMFVFALAPLRPRINPSSCYWARARFHAPNHCCPQALPVGTKLKGVAVFVDDQGLDEEKHLRVTQSSCAACLAAIRLPGSQCYMIHNIGLKTSKTLFALQATSCLAFNKTTSRQILVGLLVSKELLQTQRLFWTQSFGESHLAASGKREAYQPRE